jgi:hypothetical protein
MCYLTGMPRQFCVAQDVIPTFAPTKLTQRILTSIEQGNKFQEIQKEFLPDSLTVISSSPTDQDALKVTCGLVKRYIQAGHRNIEFAHPTEHLPKETSYPKELYVLTGIHEKDLDVLHHVRRWARSSLGIPRILVVTTGEPYRWCNEQLGCLPQFIFHVRLAGKLIG